MAEEEWFTVWASEPFQPFREENARPADPVVRGVRALDYIAAQLGEIGSIVSVEARHAALIRDMLRPHSAYFAGDDIINRAGLDVARVPSQVLPIAAPYVATPLSASQLP